MLTINHDAGQGAVWTADIMPEGGGHCVRLRLNMGDRMVDLFEPVEDEELFKKPTSYGCPILFPYANRVAGSRFSWRGREYVVSYPRHGIARNLVWEVARASESSAKLNVVIDERRSRDAFPWHLFCEIEYALSDSGLRVLLNVRNLGQQCPYTCGFHPYLQANWKEHMSFWLPVIERMELDAENLPTGNRRPVSVEDVVIRGLSGFEPHDELYRGVLVMCEEKKACYQVLSVSQDRLSRVCVKVDPNTFPFMCFYTPPGRSAVCIEPYSSATDALNHINDSDWGARILPEDGLAEFEVTFGLS